MVRSSILRAIERGAPSGTRSPDGTWLADPAELTRAFPVNTQATLQRADPVAAVKLEAARHAQRARRPEPKHNASRSRTPTPLSPTHSRFPSCHDFAALGVGCARRGDE
jgi:hypothetical protein